MAPNTGDTDSIEPESLENKIKFEQKPTHNTESSSQIFLSVFQSSLNAVAHSLIGATVAINCYFGYANFPPYDVTTLHIVMSVVGYQLLMAEGILALSDSNNWSAKLKYVHRRRVHWIMQVVGSILAIVGSVIMMIYKDVNFNTLHGQTGFAAIVFTVISLINGLTSMYTYELRKFIPGNVSKISHIFFGVLSFVLSSVSLAYGDNIYSFREWSSPELAYTTIIMIFIFTLIVIINPMITMYRKTFT